jgi:hypothetical protein
MTTKYYTPEIEEFTPWFEFEYFKQLPEWKEGQNTGCTSMTVEGHTIKPGERTPWLKSDSYCNFDDYDSSGLDEVATMIKEGRIRVKNLDREDIESLGFKLPPGGLDDIYRLSR